jgi:hypothetical protein
MKKKLNTDSIANELEGASLFFKKSSTLPSHAEPEKSVAERKVSILPDSPTTEIKDTSNAQAQTEENQAQKRSNDRTFERANERTLKPKREKIRHTFDIYRDQLVSLQSIQLDRFRAGKKKPKLGKMVSEGIDLYLKQYSSKKKRS